MGGGVDAVAVNTSRQAHNSRGTYPLNHLVFLLDCVLVFSVALVNPRLQSAHNTHLRYGSSHEVGDLDMCYTTHHLLQSQSELLCLLYTTVLIFTQSLHLLLERQHLAREEGPL